MLTLCPYMITGLISIHDSLVKINEHGSLLGPSRKPTTLSFLLTSPWLLSDCVLINFLQTVHRLVLFYGVVFVVFIAKAELWRGETDSPHLLAAKAGAKLIPSQRPGASSRSPT